jgi:diadenosine tetraphosphate (Ap4A) HIT family hydrolase
MFNIAKKISMVMFSEIGSEGTSYFIANGMSAGQKAPHVMMHVIARFEKDMVGLTPEAFEVSDNDIDKIEAKLNESLVKVFEGKGVVTKNDSNKKGTTEEIKTPKNDDKSKKNKKTKDKKVADDDDHSDEEEGNEMDRNGNDNDGLGEDLDGESADKGLEAKFENKPKKEKKIDIDKIANMFLK